MLAYAAKFPTPVNRELIRPIREFIGASRELASAIRGRGHGLILRKAEVLISQGQTTRSALTERSDLNVGASPVAPPSWLAGGAERSQAASSA